MIRSISLLAPRAAAMTLVLAGLAAVLLLPGCASHSRKKPSSYNRIISDEDMDPTYHPDPARAGEEVRYVQ